MDEIRHILVERDILAGSRGGGGWLVQLLYAFQDEESIYLAMVSTPPSLTPPDPRVLTLVGIRPRWRLPFLNQRVRNPPQRTRAILHWRNVPRSQRTT